MQSNAKNPKPTQYVCAMALMICLFAGRPVAAETLDALDGIEPLSKANLAEATGGFILPNGLNINIGIQTKISVNGKLVVTSNVTTNANAIRTANMARVNGATNNSSTGNTPSKTDSSITNPSSNNASSTVSATNSSGANTNHSWSSYNSQATYVPASQLPTISTQIQSVNGLTQITELTAGQNTIITNTASQAVISQMQRVTINVSNSAILRISTLPALTALRNVR